MTFDDLMRFRQIRQPVLSELGGWVAYSLEPDRGDSEGVVRSTDRQKVYRVERGTEPQLSADGHWAAFLVQPTFETLQKEEEAADDTEKSRSGLALVSTADGATESIDRVESVAFSADGAWLAIHHFPAEEAAAEEAAADSEKEEPPSAEPVEGAEFLAPGGVEPAAGEAIETAPLPSAASEVAPRESGATEPEVDGEEAKKPKERGQLRLRHLASGEEVVFEQVRELAFDRPAEGAQAEFLALVIEGPQTADNGLFLQPLQHGVGSRLLAAGEGTWQGELQWAQEHSRLAFLSGRKGEGDEAEEVEEIRLETWQEGGSEPTVAVEFEQVPKGWKIASGNELYWSRDGERLFLGLLPREEDEPASTVSEDADSAGSVESEEATDFDPYDAAALLDTAEVDVWHWDDPYINPHQKKLWENRDKRLFHAVWHAETGAFVQLADQELPEVFTADNPRYAIGRSDVPYRKLMTWEGRFYDFWAIDLKTGERRKVASRVSDDNVSLSPDGGWTAWFEGGHWWLFDMVQGTSRNLTEGLEGSFANEDHDYPMQVPGYGVADWTGDGRSLLLYDKFDVWQFPTAGGDPLRLTSGRSDQVIYRLIDLDEEREGLDSGEELLLLAYHDRQKHNSFAHAKVGESGTRTLLELDKKLKFEGRARRGDRLLFSRQSHAEFPNLWTTDLSFAERRQLSDANPQMAELTWGSPELVEWTSLEGEPLQGVLIKPAGYQEGQRYPVLVYYYRFFSQRLYEFNEPVINHRPSFPLYASNGYAVFLPDIRFEIGRPGLSATRSLVPGVQKLIEMGVADRERIGLHGHSWSGYQTAFMITQTDLFAAAVAGAPVTNMTSAYGGIRYSTGLARQFQYEQGQSRLGGSLWEKPWAYLENSPLFFADKIDTPLLMQFGDEDGAVPWTQGIELYLALRRLEKPAILLQYRGEGHHLKKYSNKLDYATRMKAYFDHYLMDEPAPPWITEGQPFDGD